MNVFRLFQRKNRLNGAGYDHWPLIDQCGQRKVVLTADRYLTPSRMYIAWRVRNVVRRLSWFLHFYCFGSLFIEQVKCILFGYACDIFYRDGGERFYTDIKTYIPEEYLIYIPASILELQTADVISTVVVLLTAWILWKTRTAYFHEFARKLIGVTTKIVFKPGKIVVKSGYLRRQSIPADFYIPLKTRIDSSRRYFINNNELKQFINDQSYFVDVIYGMQVIRVTEIFGRIWAERFATGIQAAYGCFVECEKSYLRQNAQQRPVSE